jgi:hypothetical protein
VPVLRALQEDGFDVTHVRIETSPEMSAAVDQAFMTGGAFTPAREFLDFVRNPRIEKPFDLGRLMAVLRPFLRST